MMKNNSVQRRRAIYTGLHPFLDGDDLMQALWLWEQNYSQQPGFSIRYYLAELERLMQSPFSTKEVLLKLVASMSATEKELLPDPGTLIEDYKHRMGIADESGQAQPELEAFKLLIEKWLSLVEGPKHFDIVRFVGRSLERIDIANDLRFSISAWLDNKNHPVKLNRVKTSDLRRITNLFYVGFCEYLGPVKADQLLSQAVHRLLSNGGACYREALSKLL